MIFDVAARSIASRKVLIPVEQLLGNSSGSRLPEVNGEALDLAQAQAALDACPTSALRVELTHGNPRLAFDYGRCIGCGACTEAAPAVFRPTAQLPHCGVSRAALVRRWDVETRIEITADHTEASGIGAEILALMGCEGEIVALSGPHYDLERFGIHFVASPKHADMLLVTGPVTRNMADALRHTWEATPAPKLVVAVGACGCSGGLFGSSYAVAGGVDAVIPVDGYIPGCPPTPSMLLTGILRVLQTAQERRQ